MRLTRIAAILIVGTATAWPVAAQDWPMWGGTPQRNMTSPIRGLPDSWKDTGKVVWQDSSPGEGILHGQWASPAIGVVDGPPSC